MKKCIITLLLVITHCPCFCWGFFSHRQINYYAVFLLPPGMLTLFKPNIGFLSEHAVDPDKRRYALPAEGSRHFIDMDHYGKYPYDSLPRLWKDAIAKYSEDSLRAHGIVPWWIEIMLARLTNAFKEKDQVKILKLSAEIGHYIADAHVPLHTCSNHNGQFTNQQGIHAFWESRVPELLANKEWDFFIGHAIYIDHPSQFIWKRILESAAASDTVLLMERKLDQQYPASRKFAYEVRNGLTIRQYSTDYSIAYNRILNNMIERRMQQSIFAVASFWYTAWVNAGQPDLSKLSNTHFSDNERKEFEELDRQWKNGKLLGKGCE